MLLFLLRNRNLLKWFLKKALDNFSDKPSFNNNNDVNKRLTDNQRMNIL